jgi:hypothetical protein
MAYYTVGVVPWNSLDDNTRGPVTSELESGYPCGEADRELFNFTAGYPIGQIYNLLLEVGITPDFTDLTQLTAAIKQLFIIDTPIIKTVYGAGADFADINAANLWLSRRRITSSGSVTLTIPAGAFNNGAVTQRLEHPDSSRINLQGSNPINGGMPAPSAFTATGNTPSLRASNAATNLALARNRLPTELKFTGLAGLVLVGIGTVSNLLVTGDGTLGSDGLYAYGGASRMTNVIAGSFGNRGIVTRGIVLALSGIVGIGCGNNGVSIETGSSASALGAVSGFNNGGAGVSVGSATLENSGFPICGCGNAGDGVVATKGANLQTSLTSASFARFNANGFQAREGGYILATTAEATNNIYGFLSANSGTIIADTSTGSGNTTAGYGSVNNSFVSAIGGAAGALVPAANTVGNSNSYIRA